VCIAVEIKKNTPKKSIGFLGVLEVWRASKLLNLIIRYFASKQNGQEYYWRTIDNWAFQSCLPTGWQASPVFGPKKRRK
jgi:hypothetical protein